MDAAPAPRMVCSMVALVATVSLSGLQFGYDTGVISGALLKVAEAFKLSEPQQEVVVASTTAGALVSAIAAAWMANRMGRRLTLALSALTFLAGCVILAVAPTFEIVVVGRTVVGLALGVSSSVTPLYLAEAAHPQDRGWIVVVNSISLTGGQFVATLLNALIQDSAESWRYMLGLGAIPAAIQAVSVLFVPESPRLLMMQGKLAQARDALMQLRGITEDDLSLAAPSAIVASSYTPPAERRARGSRAAEGKAPAPLQVATSDVGSAPPAAVADRITETTAARASDVRDASEEDDAEPPGAGEAEMASLLRGSRVSRRSRAASESRSVPASPLLEPSQAVADDAVVVPALPGAVARAAFKAELVAVREAAAEDSRAMTVLDLLCTKDRALQRATRLAMAGQAAQQLSGINIAMYYSATLLVQAGFSVSAAIWLAAALALVNVMGTAATGVMIDRVGRRPLMILSAGGAALALVAASTAFVLRDAQSPDVVAAVPPCASWHQCAYCVTDDRCGFASRDRPVAVSAAAFATWAASGACVPGSQAAPASNASALLPSGPDGLPVRWHYSDCPAKSLRVAETGFSTLQLGWWVFGSTVAYLIVFAPGLGTVPWTLQAELFPTSARAAGNALATATNWATNLVVSAFFLSLISALSAYAAFLIVAAIAGVSCWYFTVALPETRGVRLEDMHDLLSGN